MTVLADPRGIGIVMAAGNTDISGVLITNNARTDADMLRSLLGGADDSAAAAEVQIVVTKRNDSDDECSLLLCGKLVVHTSKPAPRLSRFCVWTAQAH